MAVKKKKKKKKKEGENIAFTFQPSVMDRNNSLPTASLFVLYSKICHKGIVTVTRKYIYFFKKAHFISSQQMLW